MNLFDVTFIIAAQFIENKTSISILLPSRVEVLAYVIYFYASQNPPSYYACWNTFDKYSKDNPPQNNCPSKKRINVLYKAPLDVYLNKNTQSKKISQENLALQCSIDRSYLGRIEKEEVNITIKRLYEIVKILKTVPKDF